MADPYLLSNGTLRNKLGITDPKVLEDAEGRHLAWRLAEIEDGFNPSNNYDYLHLRKLHKHLFQDVYDWAGETRTIATKKEIHVGSGKFESFSSPARITLDLIKAFEPFDAMNKLQDATLPEFIDHASQLHARLDRVHAFREGNVRTLRAFFTLLAQDRGFDMNFSVMTKERLIAARIASRSIGDEAAIQHVFEDAMIPTNTNRLERFLKFVQQHLPDWNDRSVMTQPRFGNVSGTLVGVTSSDFAMMVDNSRFVVGDVARLPYGASNGDYVTVSPDSVRGKDPSPG
jgi:cell filamentation protein